jgi:hypothetical protein
MHLMARFVVVLLVYSATCGCSDRYHSARQEHPMLMVAPRAAVKEIVYEGIIRQFPSDPISEIRGDLCGFSWTNRPFLDWTNFQLTLDPYKGTTSDGEAVNGYAIEVATRGSQPFAASRWVGPLISKINAVCEERRVLFVKISNPEIRKEEQQPNDRNISIETDVTPTPIPPTTEQRLRELDAIHAKGLVTDEEYGAKREEIIKDL